MPGFFFFFITSCFYEASIQSGHYYHQSSLLIYDNIWCRTGGEQERLQLLPHHSLQNVCFGFLTQGIFNSHVRTRETRPANAHTHTPLRGLNSSRIRTRA